MLMPMDPAELGPSDPCLTAPAWHANNNELRQMACRASHRLPFMSMVRQTSCSRMNDRRHLRDPSSGITCGPCREHSGNRSKRRFCVPLRFARANRSNFACRATAQYWVINAGPLLEAATQGSQVHPAHLPGIDKGTIAPTLSNIPQLSRPLLDQIA
jgi:hypothetical protein